MSNNPHIERLVPSIQGETAMEHLHRYAIASDLAVEKTVLDLACGEGFGSALLAQTAHQVLAVDISEPTIIAASDKYRRENLKFVVGSATKLPIETASMDIVVSFETIEHVAQQHTMLEEIARVLKPDGVLIVSTPEKEEYNSPTISPNPYHARELSRDEFDALLRTFFRNVELFGQRVTYASNVAQISLVPESATCYTTYRGNYNYAKPVPGLAQPRFLLALCSRTELPRLNIGLFEDEVYSSLIVQQAREWVTRDQVPATAQVFISHHGIFDDDHCSSVTFTRQRWRKLRMLLPPSNTSTDARVRLDPGHETSVVEIARVQLQDPEKKQSIWRARTADELSTMTVGGTGIAIPDPRVLRILNVGPDPQVLLPAIPLPTHSPLLLEVLLRVNPAADAVADCFAQLRIQQQSALQAKEQALTGAQSETESLRTQLASLEESTLKQRSVLEAKIEAFESELEQYHHRLEEAQGELTAYQAEVERLDREVWDSRVRRADFAARLREREQWIRDLKRSVAWKLAKPLWKVQRHLSKTRKRNHESHSHDIAFSLDHSGVRDDNPGAVELTGWCFSRRGPAVVGLRAKIERKSYIARYGLKRSDTRSAEGNSAALLSGFYLTFPTPDRTTTVRIEAITHEGGWQLVSTWSMKMLERPPLDQKGASATRAEEKHLFILPARANGSDPVLYPEITSDEAVKTLAPAISRHLAKVEGRDPLFSVITPAFNTKPRWFVEAAASLLNQTLPEWEWCLVDDGSRSAETRQMLESLSRAHPNVRVQFAQAAGISSATNQALDLARGEFVCFLDHDDLLAPTALEEMERALCENHDVVYSDEDKLDEQQAALTEPFYKPDWSPEYLRGVMYVGHLLCLRRELARRVRFNSNFDGVQDFEFMLRLSEAGARVGHVPKVLYHWRKVPGSVAASVDAKPELGVLQQKAVNAHLRRIGLNAEAKAGSTPHRVKIVPGPESERRKVSIVIPTKDAPELLSRCLRSIFEQTTYSSFEVILADNDTTDVKALELMRSYPVKRVYIPTPFNFSRANNVAARHASGDYLVFLNNDTEVVSRDWLDHLIYYVRQADVGAAGALLLHDSGAVQHAGVILGIRGTADHAMRGFRAESDGYAGSLSCAREVSAITAACMAISSSTFTSFGGFNEHFFTIYQDLDLCLRLRRRGLRIIWTPHAVLTHHESLSRKSYYDLVDRNLLLDQWEEQIERGDPYYNPHLNLQRGDYSVAVKN